MLELMADLLLPLRSDMPELHANSTFTFFATVCLLHQLAPSEHEEEVAFVCCNHRSVRYYNDTSGAITPRINHSCGTHTSTTTTAAICAGCLRRCTAKTAASATSPTDSI
jgi:hypothetical protein